MNPSMDYSILFQSEDPSPTPYRCFFLPLKNNKHRGFVSGAKNNFRSAECCDTLGNFSNMALNQILDYVIKL